MSITITLNDILNSRNALQRIASVPGVGDGEQHVLVAIICAANHTATNNLVVAHANMSIVRIGA